MKGMTTYLRKGMKAVQGIHHDPATPVHVIISGDEEQEHPLIIPADHKLVQPIEGSQLPPAVMIMTNHVFPGGCNPAAVPGKSLITPALAKFMVLQCVICLIVRAMN
ncbi:hypothetical protein U9M48_026587 [Paspalum notatum var. saurae]|uniref:Uncharacterized protein n=1 Tax=Paspalum notatum var. saurae TaxID=547442 RepID=A0AAQ3TWW0_PASNO